MQTKNTRIHKLGWLLADLGIGALWTLCLPPYNYLVFFFLGGFYLFWRVNRANRLRNALLTGWVWGLGVSWASQYWVATAIPAFGRLPSWFSSVATSTYMSYLALEYMVAAGFIWLIFKYVKGRLRQAGSIALVLALLDLYFPQVFPADFSIVLSKSSFWLQTMDIWGSVGVALALYFVLAWTWPVLEYMFAGSEGRKQRALAIRRLLAYGAPMVLLVLGVSVYGFYAQGRWQVQTGGKSVKISGIQTSISNEDKTLALRKRDVDAQRRIIDKHLAMSETATMAGASLVVWPETSFPAYLSADTEHKAKLVAQLESSTADYLVGAFTAATNGDSTDRFNGLFLFDGNGNEPSQQYLKSSLLIGGEYTPFYRQFTKLRQLLPDASNLSAGGGAKVIDWRGTRLGTTICYEGIQPGYMQKLAQKNPQIFINATNDSYFGDSREPDIHVALQSLRAIEYRRPLFRLANNGVSVVMDRAGRTVSRLSHDEVGVMNATINVWEDKPTFYQRAGYYLIRLVLLASGMSVALTIYQNRRKTGRIRA